MAVKVQWQLDPGGHCNVGRGRALHLVADLLDQLLQQLLHKVEVVGGHF